MFYRYLEDGFKPRYGVVAGFYSCYQFQFNVETPTLYLERDLVTDVTFFGLSIGHESSNYDGSREIEIRTDWINKTQEFSAKSNSFQIHKMQSPYSDHCFNYPDIGHRDRKDSIATCESNQTHVSQHKIVRETDVTFFNLSTMWASDDEHLRCAKTHFNPDCNQRLFLTRVTIETLFSLLPWPRN